MRIRTVNPVCNAHFLNCVSLSFPKYSNLESCEFILQLSLYFGQLSPNTTQHVGLEQLSICATPTTFAHMNVISHVSLSR